MPPGGGFVTAWIDTDGHLNWSANGTTGKVSNFTAPAGTYYALVTGAPGTTYSLTVTRDSAISAGNNVSFATAQAITPARGALGADPGPSRRDRVADRRAGG